MDIIIRTLLNISILLLLVIGPASQAQDIVLSGTVVTPDKILSKGWVVIKDGHIDSIVDKAPSGPVIQTDGIIFPGFIDLHNHPMYNIFKRWVPNTKFANRYQWRDLQEYKDLVGTPGGALQRKSDQIFCDIDEYVEVKELLGGTTSLTGVSPRYGSSQPVPNCVAGLVRNLDWASGFYGVGIGDNERIQNLLGVTPRDLKGQAIQSVLDKLADKKIDLLLVHVAEGSPFDTESTVEFRALKGVGLLGDHTAIIHGAALTSEDFQQMRTIGTALIWSPRSNMELYGFTANVDAAFQQGVTIALAPDWSPTGSTNMLAELQFASQLNNDQLFGLISDRELFEMATSIPARIARIDDKVGSIKPGLLADLFVLAGNSSQPFTALAKARPEDVQLALVGGIPLYGTVKLMSQFQVPMESVVVCGTQRMLNATGLPSGKFSDVTNRLKSELAKYNLELGPLVECTH